MDVRLPRLPFGFRARCASPRSGFASVVGPTDGPSPPSPCLSESHLPLMGPSGGLRLRRAINLSSREKRPDDAGRLVGKCNGHNSCRAPGQWLLGPDGSPDPSRIADQGGSAENQKSADVDISLLRDAAEALSASCRALLWCQTEKGREMAR